MTQISNLPRSAALRRKEVLRLLNERSYLTAREASEALRVSEVTIRTDFAALERGGALERVWGGVTLPSIHGETASEKEKVEGSFASRLHQQQAEKKAIALAAIKLVEDNDTVLLDASTTAFAIARQLREHRRNLYVITNGLHNALELCANASFTVVVLGGVVRSGTGSVVGTLGEEVLARLYAAKGFFSAQGLTVRHGLGEGTIQESQLKALMVEHTEQVIAVLDSSKLGRASFTSFCPFERINRLITAGPHASELAEPFSASGLAVQVVG